MYAMKALLSTAVYISKYEYWISVNIIMNRPYDFYAAVQ